MLFNVLNDEFVVGHIGLVPAHLSRSHSLQRAHVRSALLCFRSMQFLKINILQGSVVTHFRCGNVCNNLLNVTVKEFLKKVLLC